MQINYAPPATDRRLAGLGVTIALHLALILTWQVARQIPQQEGAEPSRIILFNPLPLKRSEPLLPPPLPPVTPLQEQVTRPRAEPAAPAVTSPPPVAEVPADAPAAVSAPAPAPSGQELLQAAKRSVGKIDRELREAYPGQPITAPVSNARTKLAEGLQNAADAAPNKWYEAPKVTEIIDPGPYSRRRYRVVTANKTYCVTYESNHAPDGLDTMKNGIQPKITTCEETETAAKKQDWSKPIGYGKPKG